MILLVKCLPPKYEDLSLRPHNVRKKKPVLAVCVPAIMVTGHPQDSLTSQPSILAEL